MSDNSETPIGGTDNVVRVNFGAAAGPTHATTEDPLADEKLTIFERLIEHGMVLVTLNAMDEHVRVPPQHVGSPRLHLNFSHRFFIDDFAYDEHGVRASLSFQGTPHFCDVPWHAVYMLRSQTQSTILVFPESFPEVLREMLPDLELVEEDAREARRAFLQNEPEEDTPSSDDEPEPPDNPPNPSGPHLRVVK